MGLKKVHNFKGFWLRYKSVKCFWGTVSQSVWKAWRAWCTIFRSWSQEKKKKNIWNLYDGILVNCSNSCFGGIFKNMNMCSCCGAKFRKAKGWHVNNNPIFRCMKNIDSWEIPRQPKGEVRKERGRSKWQRVEHCQVRGAQLRASWRVGHVFLSWTKDSSLQPPEVDVHAAPHWESSPVSACCVPQPETRPGIADLGSKNLLGCFKVLI